jgi:hypothetical protein
MTVIKDGIFGKLIVLLQKEILDLLVKSAQ